MMDLRSTATALVLTSQILSTEALSLTSPQTCYMLDVFLLLYAIIFTALFVREKFMRNAPVNPNPAAPGRNPTDPVYTDLDLTQLNSDYQQLNRPVRRREPETHYQELRGQSSDDYQQINTKPRKAKAKETRRKRDAAEAMEMNTFSEVTSYN